jgi:hypothetical protein
MNIEINNPIEYPGWDALIETSDQTTFFHTAAWARGLSESYDYAPHYFTVIDGGRLSGLLAVMAIKSCLTGKRGVSLPFSDECNPVAKDQKTFEMLLNESIAYGRRSGWKYIEIRGGTNFLPNAVAVAMHYVHTLELSPDVTEVSRRFKSNIRRNIHKAEKEGVTVAIERSRDALAAFYRLHCGTRRHHGLPPQPWSFFEKIYEYIIAAGKGFVALAGYQNRWIAGAIYALYRDQAIYKYGASDRRSQHLRPNNLVMWEAIRWCCSHAVRSFSFGRTEPENEGLLQFKRGWGASEGTLAYYRYDLRGDRFVGDTTQANKLNSLFRRMPVPLLKMAGNLLYRHMG